MAQPLLQSLGLNSRQNTPGARKYETSPTIPAFEAMTLKEKLQKLVYDCRVLNRETRLRRHMNNYLMALYYHGYQSVELSGDGGAFDVFAREDFYVENQFRKHVDTVVQMLNSMEGEVIARPGSDKPQDISKARVADKVLDICRKDVRYESLLTMKNLYKCLFGNAFTFSDYIQDKSYGTILEPKYSYQEIPDPDGGDPFMSKVQTGTTKRTLGKHVSTVCSPLEINILTDVKGPFDAIPFIQWINRPEADTVNYYYPGLNEQGSVSAVEVELASQYLEVLSNITGNVLGDGLITNRSVTHSRKVELVRSWFQPCMFRGDKELEKEFPDGVHVVTVNGKVVDFYAENLCDRWTHEVLIPSPHSLLGDGLFDALLMQDQINEMDTLFIKHMRYSTVGHKAYDATIIDPNDVINDPEFGWIPGRPPLEKSIAQAVIDIAPNALSPEVATWLARCLTSMQDMTSAYDPQTGKGIGANTPYSQSVFLSEKAQGRWKGSMDFNKPELIRFHKQLLALAQDNWVDGRKSVVSDNVGGWSFQEFTQMDLEGDVDIDISNTDMKPRSRAEQIQALEMLVTLAPVIGGLPPKQKLRIEEILGLPLDANPSSVQISRAFRMIDRIKQGQTVTPLPMVDNAMIQAPVIMDFLASEEGEDLANSQPQLYARVYTYAMTLVQMGMMHNASPAATVVPHGAPSSQPQPGQAQQQPNEQPKQPGGQHGQPGGGQGPGGGPMTQTAQTPVKPAPPISPGAPANA